VTVIMNRQSKHALWLSLAVVFLLSACGQDPPPAPRPKVQTTKITTAPATVQQTAEVSGSTGSEPAKDEAITSPSAADASPGSSSEPYPSTPDRPTLSESLPPSSFVQNDPQSTPATAPPPVAPETTVPGVASSAASATAGEQAAAPVGAAETASDLIQVSLQLAGTYDPADRFDPFEPLFKESPQIPVSTAKDARQKRSPQTPLEQVALSQLKLSAIIRAPSGNRALVEDATGKGYVVGKGTYMGLNAGQVVRIERDRLIVEEEVESLLGELTVQTTELKLLKPAGEL
jgi:type IV pilus assembly protein PilP